MAVTDAISARISAALMDLISKTPASKLSPSPTPAEKAKALAAAAAKKSAAVSGALALPAGPAGVLTLLPDLIVVWRLQQQMVADIAAVYGRTGFLTPQIMTYCMFRHSSSSLVQDLVARAGGRSLIRRASATLIKSVLKRIGLRITRLVLGKSVARLIPLVGAAAVAGYAYQDTIKVAATAIELFSRDLRLEG